MKNQDISQVSRRSGIPASRLRYYEERGLISSIGRRGLKRLFGPGIFDRLGLISLGQTAGFSLDEIAQMLGDDGLPEIDRSMLAAKADELDRTIRKLGALLDGLRHAAACPEPRHMECPKFQRLLKVVSSSAARGRRPAGAKVPPASI